MVEAKTRGRQEMKRSGKLWVIIFNIAIIIYFLSVQYVYSEEGAKVYTLNESVAEALDNNWTIKAKEEKILESEFARKQAKADFLPKFSTSYGYTRLNDVTMSQASSITLPGPTVITIPGRNLNTQDNYQWKVTINQPLFTGYALTSAYELAKLGIDLSKVELDLERVNLALKVKEAYFNILKADKAVDVAMKAVESLQSHLKVAHNFYDVGMIPINDLLKAEVELANAQYDLTRAQNGSKLSRASFNDLLARPIDSPVEVEDILVYVPDFPDYNAYLEKALKNRPEIKSIDINSDQIDQQIRLAKSKYYPEIGVTYTYLKQGDTASLSGSNFVDANSWEVLAVANWTLFEWGKTYYTAKEKESVKRQILQTKSDVEDGIRLQVKQAVLDIDSSASNIPVTQKGIESGEENLRVNAERYKAQVSTITDLLDAQTLLARARLDYYRALYDHNLAKARLDRALGNY